MKKKSVLMEYVVLWHPTDKQAEDDAKVTSKIIVDKKEVLVGSEQQAFILANRAIPEEYLNQLDQVEVIVRPF